MCPRVPGRWRAPGPSRGFAALPSRTEKVDRCRSGDRALVARTRQSPALRNLHPIAARPAAPTIGRVVCLRAEFGTACRNGLNRWLRSPAVCGQILPYRSCAMRDRKLGWTWLFQDRRLEKLLERPSRSFCTWQCQEPFDIADVGLLVAELSR